MPGATGYHDLETGQKDRWTHRTSIPFKNQCVLLLDKPLPSIPRVSYSPRPRHPPILALSAHYQLQSLPAPYQQILPYRVVISRRTRLELWFNTYRRFFAFVLSLNVIWILIAASGKWNYPRRRTSAFVLGNLQMAVLVRNELFTRCLYLAVNTFFAKWPPLCIRLACTSVLQHLGGIHSACAVAGLLWLVFHLGAISQEGFPSSVISIGIVTLLTLCVVMVSAIPWIRNTHHNTFERYHRFPGWAGLIFTWIFMAVGYSYDPSERKWIVEGGRLFHQQDFWFALFTTIFVAIPWCTVRKVPVTIEIPSPKVAILRFEGGIQQGLLARISRTAIWEYHAFGIVSAGVHARQHYLICGVQGDFTKSLIHDPPSHLWTRQLKFPGVSNTSTLYTRGVRICTGTGIGAALSTCLQSQDWYLIWIGADQEKTFGKTVSSLIRRGIAPARMTLWDSKQRGGRPDVMKLIRDVYRSWRAEVVFITSNWQGNKEMMEGCKEAGIPAFGTLWDF